MRRSETGSGRCRTGQVSPLLFGAFFRDDLGLNGI
jgi:hypothetical protein